MKMIGHNNIIMQTHIVVTDIDGVQPFLFDQLSYVIQLHFAINNVAKHTYFVNSAQGYEIQARLRIVMPRQPYASPVMNIRIIFICHHSYLQILSPQGRIAFALYFYGEMDISIAFAPIPIQKSIPRCQRHTFLPLQTKNYFCLIFLHLHRNFTVIQNQFGGCGAAIIITKEKRPRKFSTVPVSQLGLEPKTPSLKGMCSTS